MTHTFRISVARKPGLSDPEGATTLKALKDLGFTDVSQVSFGRVITVTVDGDDAEAAHTSVEDMCARLLANPVMESYEIVRVD